MTNFWRENWPWIAAPFVLIIVVAVAVVFFSQEKSGSDVVYNIF